MTEPKRTYFGLEILEMGGWHVVRKTDIQQLPFYEFWEDSAIGCVHRADCIAQPISTDQIAARYDQPATGSDRPEADVHEPGSPSGHMLGC